MAAFYTKISPCVCSRLKGRNPGDSVSLVMALDLPEIAYSLRAFEALAADLRCPALECFNRSIETGVLHLMWG